MIIRRRTGLAAAAACLAGTAVLTACGGSGATAGGDHATAVGSAGATSAAASTAAGTGATAAGAPTTAPSVPLPIPSTGGAASGSASARPTGAPGPSSHCLSGTVDIIFPGSDNPLRSVCVHVGTRLRITLRNEPGAPWRPVLSSAPGVAAVVGDTVTAGTVDASVKAVAPGSAVLSAATRAGMGAEPSDPLTKSWRLAVTVVA